MKIPGLFLRLFLGSLFLGLALTHTIQGAELSRINGRWRWTFVMPDGVETQPLVKLRYDGATLSGTSKYRHASETPISAAKVDGDRISFQVVRHANDRKVVTRYSGVMEGDLITGQMESNWSGEVQTYPWKAKRLPDTPEGTWTWTRVIGEKEVEVTLKAKLEGEKVTGKVSNRKKGGWDVLHGRFHKDGRITFELEGKLGSTEFTSHFEGVIAGDSLKGNETVQANGTTTRETWSATRAD